MHINVRKMFCENISSRMLISFNALSVVFIFCIWLSPCEHVKENTNQIAFCGLVES